MRSARTDQSLPFVAAFALAFAFMLLAALRKMQGVFSYGLDDPYIHLAIAEEIARGGYGVNPGEFAAASSSIAYPFLLVPFVLVGLGDWAPMFWNLIGGAATAALVGRAFPCSAGRTGIFVALVAAVVLGVILAGQVLLGMEHLLHAALTLAVFWGLKDGLVEKSPPAWLVGSIAALPLLRYEGLAASGLACLLIAWRGHWRSALAAGTGALAGPVLFGLFLVAHGEPPLPASILVKSTSAGAASAGDIPYALSSGFAALLAKLGTDEGRALLALAALSLTATLWRAVQDKRLGLDAVNLLIGFTLAAMIAHLGFGEVGWMARYTTYLSALGLTTAALAVRAAPLPTPVTSLGAGLVAFLALPLLKIALSCPVAARTIHDQQWRMHEFVVDYWRGPVAANDIGWLAYRNDHRVLDLWGLASREARDLRMAGNPGWEATLMHTHGIRLAIVYDNWLPGVAARWIKVGELTTEGEIAAAAGRTVSFYAADATSALRVRDELGAFATSLPASVRVALDPVAP